MYPILEDLVLSAQVREIIQLSFRSRIKEAPEGAIAFQFKIAPGTITGRQELMLELVRDEILQKLQQKYPTYTFVVSFVVAECCATECFGCTKFGGRL